MICLGNKKVFGESLLIISLVLLGLAFVFAIASITFVTPISNQNVSGVVGINTTFAGIVAGTANVSMCNLTIVGQNITISSSYNTTNVTSACDTTLNTIGFIDGAYTINMSLYNGTQVDGQRIVASVSEIITIDNTAPVVNRTTTNSSMQSSIVLLGGRATDLTLTNCSLWGDFTGQMALNQTKTDVVSGTSFNFTSIILLDNSSGYNWYINCTDALGKSSVKKTNRINISGLTSVPVAVLTPSADKELFLGQTQVATCEGTYSVAGGLASVSLAVGGTTLCSNSDCTAASCSCSGTYSVALAGTKAVKCLVTDTTGHSVETSTTWTLSVGGESSGGSSGGSGGTSVTETPTDVNRVEGSSISMIVDDVKYVAQVSTVTETSATLTVSGQTVSLAIGESKDVDLNNDGTNDVKLTLKGVENGQANISMEKILITTQAGTDTEETGEVTPTAEEGSSAWIWATVAIIVIIIGVLYFVLKKK